MQYDKIDIFKGIDINKTDASKERIICHYWYFKDIGYKFEPLVCNGCDEIKVVAYELKNVSTIKVNVLIMDVF